MTRKNSQGLPTKSEEIRLRSFFSLEGHVNLVWEANDGRLGAREIVRILTANLKQDKDQLKSALHFDNCTFSEGRDYYLNCWREVEHYLSEENRNEALASFGRILHSIQDFYSHSNWVELHLQEDPIPLWNLKLESLPENIISGTYFGSPRRCGSGAPSHEDLNKDSQDSSTGRIIVSQGPHTGKSLFHLAYNVALRHSRGEFDRLEILFK